VFQDVREQKGLNGWGRARTRALLPAFSHTNANARMQAIGKFIQLLAIQLNHSLALLCAPNLNTRAVLCDFVAITKPNRTTQNLPK